MGISQQSDNFLEKVSLKDYAETKGVILSPTSFSNEYAALCPFHSEKMPSFTLNNNKGVFYCHACGAKGNTLDFIRQINNVDTSTAFSIAKKFIGMSDNYQRKTDTYIPELYEHACQFYEQKLQKASQLIAQYLAPRGLSNASIKLFRIGAVGNSTELEEYLLKLGLNKTEIWKSGLLALNKRIVFPIIVNDKVVAFSGRRVFNSSNVSKYSNSPFFSKKTTLFLPPDLTKAKTLYVVEGFIDVISLYQNYYLAAGIMGASCSLEQLQLLENLNKNIIFCLDGDFAGLNALMAIADLIISNPSLTRLTKAKFILLPTGTDPDSLIRSDKGESWKRAAINALSFPEFLSKGGKKLMILKKLKMSIQSKNNVLTEEIKNFFYNKKEQGGQR